MNHEDYYMHVLLDSEQLRKLPVNFCFYFGFKTKKKKSERKKMRSVRVCSLVIVINSIDQPIGGFYSLPL